ncbi:MAG: NADPH:quinone oxidoreductase family protein [Hyphomicrobiaceae bacterium]
MLAVVCRAWMPYRELPLENVPPPPLGPGQVRIGTHYAGVSFATTLVTEGRYQRKPPFPFSPGTEVAGEVLEVGPGVTRIAPGDRVCAALDWGGHAEEAIATEATVHKLPDGLPFDLAPQFPLSYGTAHGGLAWAARLVPGETVLVTGAAGAVGLAAVEIAKAMGARVVAAASTPAKLAAAAAHGADATVLLPSPDAVAQIRATAPAGVDCVFDPVGGDAFDVAMRAVAEGGRIVVIGFAGGRVQQVPANILLVKNVAVPGFNYGRYVGWGRVDERARYEADVRGQMSQLFDWLGQGRLRPATSHKFPLRDYRAAMTAVIERQGIGKIVLQMPRAERA